MDSFLSKFFPTVYEKETKAHNENMYCKFESHMLQLFTSSLYLAALVASFFASTVTRTFGRKISMLFGGFIFLVGAILNGAATNVAMLIIGRLLLGVGVGFANQVLTFVVRVRDKTLLAFMINFKFQFLGLSLFQFIYRKWHQQISEEH